MKKAKARQQSKIFFGFQIGLGLLAAVISLVFMLPNKFRSTHRAYVACQKKYQRLPADQLTAMCPKPYTTK